MSYYGKNWRGSKWIRFGRGGRGDFPSLPCCYAIYADGELVYIGQTVDLKSRMANHVVWNGTQEQAGKKRWGHASVLIVKARFSDRLGDWLMREARLISRIKPSGNTKLLHLRAA
jgi:excinuclease UvrABC nuclease subunit